MGITARIVLPFLLLIALVIAASSWAAVRQATRGVEHRLEQMTHDLAGITAEGGFLLSPPFLSRIKTVFRAEAVACEGEPPRVEAATFPADALAAVRAAVILGDGRSGLRDPVLVAGRAYVMTWSRVAGKAGGGPRALVLFFSSDEIRAEKANVAWPLIATGAVGLLLASLVGYVIARSITQPIRVLAEKTKEIAAGAPDQPIQVRTHDELDNLARAFEHMTHALRTREQELVRAEQLAVLGRITTRIAHEIRNPLAAMKLTVQMRLEDETNPQAREELDRIVREIDRLQLTVEELLGAASPVELRRAPEDVNAVIRDVLALLERQIAHREVALELALAALPELPLDRNRFKQVLLNLALNALDALPGGGRLRVTSARADDAALVEVCDSGPGLPEALEQRAFEPFVTTRSSGTGLGLPVARSIVEKHGGSLTYLRRDGWTVFRIRLPLA